jgi:hypothetical protein
MPAETYAALTQALADILALQQQGGKYIGQSFATKAALNAYTLKSTDNPGDFTFVLDDETKNDATTRYIISGAKTPTDTRAWSFGYVINYDPTGLATTAAAGLVKSTAATDGNEGKTFVETDGTMSVIGWDSLVAAVGTLSGLTTTAKSSLVAAINEIKATLNTKANETSSFTEAATRANIASGESVSTIFGKIKKFFSDLKSVAFTGSYSDLSNKPTIPTIATTGRLLKGDGAGNATAITATVDQLVRANGTGVDIPTSLPANGGNADTVGGMTPDQMGENGYIMKKYVIDTTGLNEDTYYPVTINLENFQWTRIAVYVKTGPTSNPSWGNYNDGFSCVFLEEAIGDMWGAFINMDGMEYNKLSSLRRILFSGYTKWILQGDQLNPIGNVGQMTHSNNEYIYVRGGGKYFFYVSHNRIPVLRTETFAMYEQSISPLSLEGVNYSTNKRNVVKTEDMPTVFTGATPPASGFKDGDIFIKS